MEFLEKTICLMMRRACRYLEKTGRTDGGARFPYLFLLIERLEKEEEPGGEWTPGEEESKERTPEEEGSEKRTPEEEESEERTPEEEGPEERAAEKEAREMRVPEEGRERDDSGTAGQRAENGQEKRGAGIRERRYRRLLALLSGSENDSVMKNAVELALAAGQVSEFAAYLNYYTGCGATLQLSYELENILFPDYTEAAEKWKRLRYAFAVEEKSPLTYANIGCSHEVLSYLAGGDGLDVESGGWAVRFGAGEKLQPMYVRRQLCKEGKALLAEAGTALQIAGEGGRRFLARHIAERMGKGLLLLKAQGMTTPEDTAKERRLCALRAAFLDGDVVCMYGITARWLEQARKDGADFFSDAVLPFLDAGIPVILCTDGAVFFSGLGAERISRLELTALDRKEREAVFEGFAQDGLFAGDPEVCSVRYRLNASEIAAMVLNRRKNRRAGEEERAFSEAGGRLPDGVKKPVLGRLLEPRAELSELVLPPRGQRTLKEICCGASQGHRIYEEWGLNRCYPYGRAVSVLLAGGPGTGKTMTAHAIAHELGMPLYQVELSRLLDKYIGETEKRLEQVFDYAEKTNTVLFFDEADAMFGRRAEVTEGKDRYANMEVSYLLQRMEQYDGVIVLATNFYHNIDKAFLRRLKYVIQYQAPDAALRRKIWGNCLPCESVRETLDLDYLAGQFAMTGGMIKNVLQCACIAALSEKRPLGMTHVLNAVRMEYEKMERSVTAELWGEYGYLME